MPIYEYRCSNCGFEKEYLRKLSDPPLSDCPQCAKATFSKKVTAAGFQLKGGGWYATDFKGSPKVPQSEGKGDSSGDGSPATKESSGNKEPASAKETSASKDSSSSKASGDNASSASKGPSGNKQTSDSKKSAGSKEPA